jgi:hypothetical protein
MTTKLKKLTKLIFCRKNKDDDFFDNPYLIL